MRILVFALLLPLLAGCGYQSGQITSGQGRTLAVPLFKNETFRRDLEKDLTRAVHQEIAARTNYHLVAEDRADLLMQGRIVGIQEAAISEREGGIIRESSVFVRIEVRVTDLKTGEVVVGITELQERQPFVPVTGESLRTAELAAFRNLAEKIVYLLQAEW